MMTQLCREPWQQSTVSIFSFSPPVWGGSFAMTLGSGVQLLRPASLPPLMGGVRRWMLCTFPLDPRGAPRRDGSLGVRGASFSVTAEEAFETDLKPARLTQEPPPANSQPRFSSCLS